MKLKSTVKVVGLKSEILLAMIIVDHIYTANDEELVITSVTDSVHTSGSFHFSGNAFDCRINNFADVAKANIITTLIKNSLTEQYDVVLEVDHIHVEFQPKK